MDVKIIIVLNILLISSCQNVFAQGYETYPIKEEYDKFNIMVNNWYKPCEILASNDGGTFGDGMSYVLDGYITMYETTQDKAYLYKYYTGGVIYGMGIEYYLYSEDGFVICNTFQLLDCNETYNFVNIKNNFLKLDEYGQQKFNKKN